MKLTLLSGLLFFTTSIFAQAKESDIPLQTKYANDIKVHICENGETSVVIDDFIYFYDREGNLIGSPKPVQKVEPKYPSPTEGEYKYKINTNLNQRFIKELDADVTNERMQEDNADLQQTLITINRSSCDANLQIEQFLIDDPLIQTSSQMSGSKGSKVSESHDITYLGNDILLLSDLYISTSDKSHSGAVVSSKTSYNTFLHLIKLDLKTGKYEISNHLIDKSKVLKSKDIEFSAYINDVLNGKLYVTFKSNRLHKKGEKRAPVTFTMWSLDLETKEEENVFETEIKVPEDVLSSAFPMIDEETGNCVVQVSWLIEEKEGKTSYCTSHHKIYEYTMDGKCSLITEMQLDIPANVLALSTFSWPSGLATGADADGNLVLTTVVSKPLDAMGTYFDYYLYKFKPLETGDFEQSVQYIYSNLDIQDRGKYKYDMFLKHEFTDEEYKTMFEGDVIKNKEEICKLCRERRKYYSRIVDGKVHYVVLETLPEANCINGRCEIKKMSIRIGEMDL